LAATRVHRRCRLISDDELLGNGRSLEKRDQQRTQTDTFYATANEGSG